MTAARTHRKRFLSAEVAMQTDSWMFIMPQPGKCLSEWIQHRAQDSQETENKTWWHGMKPWLQMSLKFVLPFNFSESPVHRSWPLNNMGQTIHFFPPINTCTVFDPQLRVHGCRGRLYVLFYTIFYRSLSIHRFWYPQGVLESIPHRHGQMT